MRLKVDNLEIISNYGELAIQEDSEQKCIHIWFIPTNATVEVDGNHIRIQPHPIEKLPEFCELDE